MLTFYHDNWIEISEGYPYINLYGIRYAMVTDVLTGHESLKKMSEITLVEIPF